jgi:dTDP-4-amino-4,6-dideoxygalactose transaminase
MSIAKLCAEKNDITPGIPLSFSPWPHFAEDDIEAAVSVLRSGKVNYWTGEHGRCFEREFAEISGTKYAVAVANGTLALELALHSIGIQPGDEVVTSSRTFIASASCVAVMGALPVFADIDRDSQNITADTIRKVLSKRTKAIIVVHLAGWPCDMDPILYLAREYNIKVIEDCAQAQGAQYKGRPVGSLGDVAAFSFCQDKIMTTAGEGGMLTTNDSGIWERAWSYKDHGKSFALVYSKQHPPGFRWLHESFGSNWRLTEVQSAIGRTAIRKLPQWLESRRRNATILGHHFRNISALRIPAPPIEVIHAWYKYYAFVVPSALQPQWSRDRIIGQIVDRGIPCMTGSCSEIYLEKAFSHISRPPRLHVARELGETSLMFQVHPTLSEIEMHTIAQAVEEVFLAAAK